MADKRKREDGGGEGSSRTKKAKHGFRVGPANLPDGTYKRHNDKVKKGLIERAQIKKKYAKVKQRFEAEQTQKEAQADGAEVQNVPQTAQAVSTTPHPDRLDMMSRPEAEAKSSAGSDHPQPRRQRKPKPNAYSRETKEAERKREEAEARRIAREEADKQRQEKIAERERFRKAMAKARGPDGQRKLGRESNVLLMKVKRMVAEGKT